MGKVGVCCEYRAAVLHFFSLFFFFLHLFLPDAGWNLHLLQDCTSLLTLPHLTSHLSPSSPSLSPSPHPLLFVYASLPTSLFLSPSFLPGLASFCLASPLLFANRASILLPLVFFHLSFACNLFHRVCRIHILPPF